MLNSSWVSARDLFAGLSRSFKVEVCPAWPCQHQTLGQGTKAREMLDHDALWGASRTALQAR